MPWTRLDETFHQHPKIVGLSSEAFRLYVCSITWSTANLTDGLVPPPESPKGKSLRLGLDVSARRLRKITEELELAGLWEPQPDGSFRIHDFLKYQPSKADVERERAAARERQRRRRSGDIHTDFPYERHAVTPPVSPPVTESLSPRDSARTEPLSQRESTRESPRESRMPSERAKRASEKDPGGKAHRTALDVIPRARAGQEALEEPLTEEQLDALSPTQAHLLRKIAKANPSFAEITAPRLKHMRKVVGDPLLTEALMRLSQSIPKESERPAAYIEAIIAEVRKEAERWHGQVRA